ncbi:unnamed protein product [Calypogeia fissa]
MGSLLGWETSPSRSDQVMKRSNSSVTKEEVEKFWLTKKLLMQEHLDEANKEAALSPRLRLARAMADEIDAQQKLAEGVMSMSMPETNSRAWWTKSRWAFLNDPPTVNVKESKYVAQFDVASLGQLQPDNPSY